MSAIGDPQLLKLINQGFVYRLLRAKPGLSRAQLSHCSGLTKSTISLLVKELIEDRWLVESEAFSKNPMGRPSTSIFVDTQFRSLIGVEITKDLIQLVAVSTSGEVRFTRKVGNTSSDMDAVLALVASLVCEASDQIQNSGLLLGGIGLAFSGVFDENSGTLRSSPDFTWSNEPIVKKLRMAFKKMGLSDIPFFVHSKSHCCAVGAYEFSEQRADTLMYLDFSQSIQTTSGIPIFRAMARSAQSVDAVAVSIPCWLLLPWRSLLTHLSESLLLQRFCITCGRPSIPPFL